MTKHLHRRWLAPALSALALLALSGCAGMGEHRGRVDPDALNNAIVADHVDYVAQAVRAGALNVNQRIPAPAYAEGTPLITVAARAGAVEVTRFLIAAGANLNARTPANETALMLAVYFPSDTPAANDEVERNERVARLLVEAGASIENTPDDYTPLAYAAYQNRERTLAYLLGKGANVDGGAPEVDAYVNTPLMMAAMQGHAGPTLTLLRAQANPRIRKYDGNTASTLAAKHHGRSLLPALQCAERLAPGQRFADACRAAIAELEGAGSLFGNRAVAAAAH